MVIKELLERFKARNEKATAMEEDMRIQRNVQMKQLSANERDLMARMERERQEQIKQKLDEYRKKDQDDFWTGHSIMQQNSMLKQDSNVLHNQKQVMQDNPKMFSAKGNMI